MTSTTPVPARAQRGLSDDYRRIRRTSLDLASPLAPEDQVVQTLPEVSPTKWHLAHVTWFFERFCLMEHAPGYKPYREPYLQLFNSYYHAVGEMYARAQRGLLSRPTVSEVHAYRGAVDDAMVKLIGQREGDDAFAFLVTLGLNHEQQHQELLLADIKHVLLANPLGPAYDAIDLPASRPAEALAFVERPGGEHSIGANGGAFCFDNETPRHRLLVGEHALGNRLVTNGEYRQFIDDGGYSDPLLWLADGWAKIDETGWNRPLGWSDDLEREFTLGGWKQIDAHAPVCHVSFYEAASFARWAGARLPSEAEWELAANDVPIEGNLLDARHLHPISRGQRTEGEPTIAQIFGDVWEWTASSYSPFPGFRPLAGSLGEYNGKFMCNQMVVRGGSCVTWSDHIRASYRSFFYPHDRWQFLGFRLAHDR